MLDMDGPLHDAVVLLGVDGLSPQNTGCALEWVLRIIQPQSQTLVYSCTSKRNQYQLWVYVCLLHRSFSGRMISDPAWCRNTSPISILCQSSPAWMCCVRTPASSRGPWRAGPSIPNQKEEVSRGWGTYNKGQITKTAGKQWFWILGLLLFDSSVLFLGPSFKKQKSMIVSKCHISSLGRQKTFLGV